MHEISTAIFLQKLLVIQTWPLVCSSAERALLRCATNRQARAFFSLIKKPGSGWAEQPMKSSEPECKLVGLVWCVGQDAGAIMRWMGKNVGLTGHTITLVASRTIRTLDPGPGIASSSLILFFYPDRSFAIFGKSGPSWP